MTPEDAKKIKCDRCATTFGLYRHSDGWRCPVCIWNERENLIAWAGRVLDIPNSAKSNKGVLVPRDRMDALAEVVKEVTSPG